jgi:hypothetical protein
MICHVLPGDSLALEFKKTEIDGEVIVCRDALVVGPVDAETPFEFWDERGRFILAEYGEDEILYHERVADELERLTDLEADTEVNLWFEYELFCSVNMWFCLSLLSNTGAAVYRVEPKVLSPDDRWKGFGTLDATALTECCASRVQFKSDDLKLGTDLWNAFRTGNHAALGQLAAARSACFPYLDEVCEAAIEKDTRPAEILAEIEFEGKTTFEEVFPEFTRRAGVYGFGDLQVKRILETRDSGK